MKIIPIVGNKIKVGTKFKTVHGKGMGTYIILKYDVETQIYYLDIFLTDYTKPAPWAKDLLEPLFLSGEWVQVK